MYKLNEFGPEGNRWCDIIIGGELWTLGPDNYCQFICDVRLYWEVHFYPERGPEPVGRWFIRNAASDEQGRSTHG